MKFLLIFMKAAVILFCSIKLSCQDCKTNLISDRTVFLSTFIMVILQLCFYGTECWRFFVSSLLMYWFYKWVRNISRKKLGEGDVIFGLFQGISVEPFTLWLVILSETVFCWIFTSFCKIKKKKSFPFIPFMSAGLIFTFLQNIFQPCIYNM